MQAKKKFGQNFLINEQIIQDIVNEIDVTPNDLIIEIGPGMGALTKYLANKDCNVLCIEIDNDMKTFLDKYTSNHLEVIYTDILNSNISKLVSNYKYDHLYIIGNLPYYITSPILTYIIDSKINPDAMVFMVQDEVAKRFTSSYGNSDYGYMTIYLNNYFDVSYEFFVSKVNFNPAPKVDSAIIKLLKKQSNIPNGYFNFIKDAFSMKRKTLKNNLKNYDWDKISSILKENNLSDTVRAEEIPDEVFKQIYNNL